MNLNFVNLLKCIDEENKSSLYIFYFHKLIVLIALNNNIMGPPLIISSRLKGLKLKLKPNGLMLFRLI